MRRVLVTGGSGFTGKEVIRCLHDSGQLPIALARSTASANLTKSLGASVVMGDLDDDEGLSRAFVEAEADALINIASLGFGQAPAIIRAAEKAGINRCVFVSTTGIFTRLNPASKAIRLDAESSIENSNLAWTIIRPTMIYGLPGDRNMERLLKLLKKTPIVPLPNGGRFLQQPVHVQDLAAALARTVSVEQAIGQAYNLSGAEALSLRSIVQQAAVAVSKRPVLVHVPLQPVRMMVGFLEKIMSSPMLKVEQIDRLEEDKAFDHTAAARDLDFNPRTFQDGITGEADLLLDKG